MAWSELTVTPPNPTPPTNMSFTGTTAPNRPNYTKNTYNDPKNWSWINPKDFPPPYYDDGTAGSITAIAANTAALASGSGATAGGTEGTYPGGAAGAVPASTSVAPEATALVTVLTLSVPNTHPPSPSVAGQLSTVSTMGTFISEPNRNHPSAVDVAPASAPTITGLVPTTGGVSNANASQKLVVNGTGFRQNSVVLFDDIAQPTQFNSITQLQVNNARSKTTAGNIAIKVKTGATATAGSNWAFT